MGGAGKTSLAVEYAHRQAGGRGVVWQLSAGDPAGLAVGFAELAAHLSAEDGGGPVGRVHAVLARRSDWLLVFDNVPDPAAVAGLVPPAGRGRVVITSQFGFWPGRQVLEVPVLHQAVAAGFLIDRTSTTDAEEETAAFELAGELGGLPLALEQAGAYMQASGRSIGGYLGLFRARRAELLARADPAGYDKRVATTWTLALAGLGGAGSAAGLLRLVACCAAEDIPLDLLLRPGLAAEDFDARVAPVLLPLLGDELARDEAVAGLRRFSLISAPRGGLVSVHRLVQAITLDQLPQEEADAWRQAAAAVIETALADDPEDPGPGRCSRRCCRMPRLRSTRPVTACTSWPATSARAAATPRRWPCNSRSCMPEGKHWAPSTRHAHLPCQSGRLDRGGGGCGRGPGPVGRAGAGHRAGPGRRAPRHARRPRQSGLLGHACAEP